MAEYIERESTLHRMKVDIAPPFKVVAEMPAADVAPVRHGRWEKASNLEPKCSVCGEYHLYAWPDHKNCNYCPNCGAKMDGGAD